MTTLEVPIHGSWLSTGHANSEDLKQELREVLAAKLFELGRVTLVQASEIAGLSVRGFMERLSRLNVSVINLGLDDLHDELQGIPK